MALGVLLHFKPAADRTSGGERGHTALDHEMHDAGPALGQVIGGHRGSGEHQSKA
jgi:hypothetical protein